MISSLFHSIIFKPFYNGLIFLIDKLPFADAGIVIIIFTILTKINFTLNLIVSQI